MVARLQGRAEGVFEAQERGQASKQPPWVLAGSSRAKGMLAPARGSRAGANMKMEVGLNGSSSGRPESIRQAENGINKDERNVSEEGYDSKRRGLTERMGRHRQDSEKSPNSSDCTRASGVWQQPG